MTEKGNMSRKVMSNLIWRFAERCGAQGVSFVVSIVLARLLMPEDYGTIALVTVFITILDVFIDSGLGNALIQKKNADNVDFSTIFFFNIFMCSVLYLMMFFAAPFIADFYNDSELTPIVRVLSLTLIISGVKNIQQSYVSKTMQFKRFFFATLGGTIGAAIVGIAMAYAGFGVWALVIQQIFNALVDTVILWITVKWRPKFVFSFKRFKALFSYGWKLLISSLIDTVYNDIRQLIIGKMYSSSDLGFYNKGKQLPNLVVTNINTSINSVLFPAMSHEQDDTARIKNMTKRSIRISIYVMAPLMIGIVFCAPTLIELLLTEKWLPCVPYLRIFCITYMFYPVNTANLNAIKALGRSDLFLKLEIIKKIVGVLLLVSTMWFGVMAMTYSLLVSCILSQFINSLPNKKLLNYGYWEQFKDMFSSISLALFMGICVGLIDFIPMPLIIKLIIQIVSGAIIYIAGSILLKNDSFFYLWGIFKEFKKKHSMR